MSCRQSRRLLETQNHTLPDQVIDSSARGNVIQDFIVTRVREPGGDIKIRGSLGCSDRALVGFAILGEPTRKKIDDLQEHLVIEQRQSTSD